MAHNTSDFSNWTNPVEIPPLETTDATDRKKEEANEALEFSSDGQYQYVKCQKCAQDV